MPSGSCKFGIENTRLKPERGRQLWPGRIEYPPALSAEMLAECAANERMLAKLDIPEGDTSLEEIERALVEASMRQSSGNQAQPALR